MKASALLVNTSRGPILDEAALIEALAQRRFAHAAGLRPVAPSAWPTPAGRHRRAEALPHVSHVGQPFRAAYSHER